MAEQKEKQKLEAKTEAKAKELGVKLQEPIIYVNAKTGHMHTIKKAAQMGAASESHIVEVKTGFAKTARGGGNAQG